jgi:hypothetical protein
VHHFRVLSLAGYDFALAGAGGGTLPSRRFGDETRKWAQDAKRGEDGVAYSKRLPSFNSKKIPEEGSLAARKRLKTQPETPSTTADAHATATNAEKATTCMRNS